MKPAKKIGYCLSILASAAVCAHTTFAQQISPYHSSSLPIATLPSTQATAPTPQPGSLPQQQQPGNIPYQNTPAYTHPTEGNTTMPVDQQQPSSHNPYTANSFTTNSPAPSSSSSQSPALNCGHEGFAFSQLNVHLNSDQTKPFQRIFLLHNYTKHIVIVNHQVKFPSASAGWSSTIHPGQWSALAVNRPDFSLVCMSLDPPQFKMTSCQQVLAICALPSPQKNLGTYWLVENNSLDYLLQTLKKRHLLSS